MPHLRFLDDSGWDEAKHILRFAKSTGRSGDMAMNFDPSPTYNASVLHRYKVQGFSPGKYYNGRSAQPHCPSPVMTGGIDGLRRPTRKVVTTDHHFLTLEPSVEYCSRFRRGSRFAILTSGRSSPLQGVTKNCVTPDYNSPLDFADVVKDTKKLVPDFTKTTSRRSQKMTWLRRSSSTPGLKKKSDGSPIQQAIVARVLASSTDDSDQYMPQIFREKPASAKNKKLKGITAPLTPLQQPTPRAAKKRKGTRIRGPNMALTCSREVVPGYIKTKMIKEQSPEVTYDVKTDAVQKSQPVLCQMKYTTSVSELEERASNRRCNVDRITRDWARRNLRSDSPTFRDILNISKFDSTLSCYSSFKDTSCPSMNLGSSRYEDVRSIVDNPSKPQILRIVKSVEAQTRITPGGGVSATPQD